MIEKPLYTKHLTVETKGESLVIEASRAPYPAELSDLADSLCRFFNERQIGVAKWTVKYYADSPLSFNVDPNLFFRDRGSEGYRIEVDLEYPTRICVYEKPLNSPQHRIDLMEVAKELRDSTVILNLERGLSLPVPGICRLFPRTQ